jgi:hypothetical protein
MPSAVTHFCSGKPMHFYSGVDSLASCTAFAFGSGARGTFHLAMQGPSRSERRIILIGDDARLDGVFEDGHFAVLFIDAKRGPLVWSADERGEGGHGGGDRVTMLEFLNACASREPPLSQTHKCGPRVDFFPGGRASPSRRDGRVAERRRLRSVHIAQRSIAL